MSFFLNRICLQLAVNFNLFHSSFLGLITFAVIVSTLYDVIRTSQGRKIETNPVTFHTFSIHLFVIHSNFVGSKNMGLLAFSFYTNGMKIFSCKQNKSQDVMECLNGIRVISTFWVLYGHAHALILLAPVTNLLYIKTVRLKSNIVEIITILIFTCFFNFFPVVGPLLQYVCSIRSHCRWHVLFHERSSCCVVDFETTSENVSFERDFFFFKFLLYFFEKRKTKCLIYFPEMVN